MLESLIEILKKLDVDIEADHVIFKPYVFQVFGRSFHAERHPHVHTLVALVIVLKMFI